MGECGSPSRKVYGSEEEQDVMMVYTACDGVAIIISVLVDVGCVLSRELFPCSVLFYAVSLR